MKLGVLLVLLVVLCVLVSACDDDPRVSVRIVRRNASRVNDKDDRRVVMDVDVEAHEGLGKSVGNYCVSVLFPGESDYRDQCGADLQDGDTKSFRFISKEANLTGGNIRVVARVGGGQSGLEDVPVPP